ncbi:hypothetical protein PIB30_039349 [Stylosanthes scabra]|uniref:Chalcone-flavonone isomerase family protein n=1 Tax=Stylosanthes scabra TaxID=79078 RepID=A0ABU6UD01_9FABA|nr:hypothetical protein [Stylosanthes scabra]
MNHRLQRQKRIVCVGPFEKLIRGSKIRPLSGVEYSKKVMENCVAHMKSVGDYGEAEAAAIQEFAQAFNNVHFKPGASVFYRQSPLGFLALSFSEDGNMPEKEAVVIENEALSSAVLETMIGEHAVSPDLKSSLVERLPAVLQKGFCFVGGLLRARCRPTTLSLAKSEWQPWFPPSAANSVAFSVAACRRGLRGGLNNSVAVGFGLFHRWPTNPRRHLIVALRNSAPLLRPYSDLELGIKRHKGMSYIVKSAGSDDSSTSGDRICKCGLIAQMKVSNSEANPRREYYSCPDGKCRWFRWAGPAVKCPVRVGAQNRERDAEEFQVGLGSSLLVYEVECTKLVPSNESS